MSEPFTLAAGISALLAGGGLALWPWARMRLRFLIGAGATFLGYEGWHLLLNVSNGRNFDVDNPALLGLSAEDVGSGIVAYVLAVLILGLVVDRKEPSERVVTAGVIVGLLAIVVDRFS